jgi:tetratricopeptide (TPR) repeat protein
MLGIVSEEPAEARKWLQETRRLASEGFADSIGVAAHSCVREADLSDEGPEALAQLGLQAVASGDTSGIGVMAAAARAVVANEAKLLEAARSDTLRPIVSGFLLSCTGATSRIYERTNRGDEIAPKWLAACEAAGVERMESASALGWIAYSLGRFDEAERWLARARKDAPLALWLKAKLDLRAGKIADATSAMARAVRGIPQDEAPDRERIATTEPFPFEAASGDLAMLRLARGEFDGALQFFLAGHHWQDAAYVAERVLTVDELAAYVRQHFPKPGPRATTFVPGHYSYLDVLEQDGDYDNEDRRDPELFDDATRMRYLLARRLVRAGRYHEARPYFPPSLQPELDKFMRALNRARSPGASTRERAQSFWEAANIARHGGMELMGTEVEPDAAVWGGSFETEDVSAQRLAGRYADEDVVAVPAGFEAVSGRGTHERQIVLPVSADERARLKRNRVTPDKRFHYRYVAADFAWRAAKLMPDNDAQTAFVLNTAGTWLKGRDDEAADRFYQAIERRCAKTEIGRAAIEIHWFPSLPRPPQQ